MLSRQERAALDRIDRMLSMETPDLAASFARWEAPAPRPRRWPLLATVPFLLALTVAGLVVASAVMFWLGALGLGTVIGLRRLRRGPRPRPRPGRGGDWRDIPGL
jgi:hypothetical protein